MTTTLGSAGRHASTSGADQLASRTDPIRPVVGQRPGPLDGRAGVHHHRHPRRDGALEGGLVDHAELQPHRPWRRRRPPGRRTRRQHPSAGRRRPRRSGTARRRGSRTPARPAPWVRPGGSGRSACRDAEAPARSGTPSGRGRPTAPPRPRSRSPRASSVTDSGSCQSVMAPNLGRGQTCLGQCLPDQAGDRLRVVGALDDQDRGPAGLAGVACAGRSPGSWLRRTRPPGASVCPRNQRRSTWL